MSLSSSSSSSTPATSALLIAVLSVVVTMLALSMPGAHAAKHEVWETHMVWKRPDLDVPPAVAYGGCSSLGDAAANPVGVVLEDRVRAPVVRLIREMTSLTD